MLLEPEFVRLAAWAVFAGSCGLSLFLGAVLAYHWFQYAMSATIAISATIVYAVGSLICLAGIAYTILIIT